MQKFVRLGKIRKITRNGELGQKNYIFPDPKHSNQIFYQMKTLGNQKSQKKYIIIKQ